ncbi:13782_t:CDS:2, partial [Acaulospora colombiana]
LRSRTNLDAIRPRVETATIVPTSEVTTFPENLTDISEATFVDAFPEPSFIDTSSEQTFFDSTSSPGPAWSTCYRAYCTTRKEQEKPVILQAWKRMFFMGLTQETLKKWSAPSLGMSMEGLGRTANLCEHEECVGKKEIEQNARHLGFGPSDSVRESSHNNNKLELRRAHHYRSAEFVRDQEMVVVIQPLPSVPVPSPAPTPISTQIATPVTDGTMVNAPTVVGAPITSNRPSPMVNTPQRSRENGHMNTVGQAVQLSVPAVGTVSQVKDGDEQITSSNIETYRYADFNVQKSALTEARCLATYKALLQARGHVYLDFVHDGCATGREKARGRNTSNNTTTAGPRLVMKHWRRIMTRLLEGLG